MAAVNASSLAFSARLFIAPSLRPPSFPHFSLAPTSSLVPTTELMRCSTYSTSKTRDIFAINEKISEAVDDAASENREDGTDDSIAETRLYSFTLVPMLILAALPGGIYALLSHSCTFINCILLSVTPKFVHIGNF